MSGPNAFSIRRAISGVNAALPCRRSESVARRTFKISAARLVAARRNAGRVLPSPRCPLSMVGRVTLANSAAMSNRAAAS